MPRLLMVGLSHHAAPVELRERVAIDETAWRAAAPRELATVLLSTCNRAEVYAWIDGRTQAPSRLLARCLARAAGMSASGLQPYLSTRVGTDALLHLVRVTSGLDSLVVGEEQIRGQVREALRAAEECQPLPFSLRGIFQRAMESARRVRGSTTLGQAPSVAAAGVNVAARAIDGGLRGKLVVVLGAGVMARAAAEALQTHGARVRVLNRTPAHAERLMGKLGGIEINSLEALPPSLADAVLVVGATASRQPLVTAAALEVRNGRPLVLLDIALPRDIDPLVRSMDGITLIDLDDLERLCPVDTNTRHAERQHAERLAKEEADRLAEWLRFRAVSPAITELRTYAEGIRASEMRRSASRLRDLTPEQFAAVDALTVGIVKKLMHGPTVALRDARSHARIMRVLKPRKDRTRLAND